MVKSFARMLAVAAVLAYLISTWSVPGAHASGTWTVESLVDGPTNVAHCPGPSCTLRDAIAAASSGDTINFGVTGTMTLTQGPIVIDRSLTITGPGVGSLTLDAAGSSGVLEAVGGLFNSSVSGMTLTGGNSTANEAGGGVFANNIGSLTLDHMVITGNSAGTASGYNFGGGVYLSQGTYTITNSEISGNTVVSGTGTTQGGGIFVSYGTLNLANVTVSGNHSGTGGGKGEDGGLKMGVNATGNLTNVTIAGNDSGVDSGGLGVNSGATAVNIHNVLIAGNSSPSRPDCGTFGLDINSLDYNLIQDTSGCAISGTTTHNITGSDPLLGALANNGGPTKTMALQGGSPAIDAGDNAACTAAPVNNVDQRGRPRNADGDHNGTAVCDIGAYEAPTFADLPVAGKEWMEAWINAFYNAGVTTGCGVGPLIYCPENNVTRAEMAVFLLRAIHGKAYTPPNVTGIFADMPVVGKEWMEPWVDEFYNEGITTGCGTNPLIYCPENNVTRAEMAVFILRAVHGSSYTPPAVTGIFADMPVAGKEWMEPWVDEFYNEGITTGCGSGPLIYCPENNVTRAEMAVFIDRAFHLYP